MLRRRRERRFCVGARCCLNFQINFQLMAGDLERATTFNPPALHLSPRVSLELMKKCFQHQFLILLSVICYSAALCSLARALFNPFNVHPSFVIFLITASHNIHSCNALLSFFIIYIHKMCTINQKKSNDDDEEEGM